MTLIGAILKKVQSKDSLQALKYGGNTSPPPELSENDIKRRIGLKKKKRVEKFAHITACVDSSPPKLYPRVMFQNLPTYKNNYCYIYAENMRLVAAIKALHFSRGRVDCRWKHPPKRSLAYFWKRESTLKNIQDLNLHIYRLLQTVRPRVATTRSLLNDWATNREEIINGAEKPFVLFPVEIREQIEDPVFLAPDGFKRPRVYLSLRVQGGSSLGSLCVELMTDVCPVTCRLFLDLLDGDQLGHGYVGTCFFSPDGSSLGSDLGTWGQMCVPSLFLDLLDEDQLGHGYVGTRFFRKVPNLYWSGGDVIKDNGFGCYAQRCRRVPVGAENYHYPHSIPGLLSMRVTPNDEMCGIFNITFKPLPQFDLKNVVFGRVIRPNSTYDTIRSLGTPLGSHPIILIASTHRMEGGSWIRGASNTRISRHQHVL